MHRLPAGSILVDGAKADYATPVRSEFTEIFQALSSHSGM